MGGAAILLVVVLTGGLYWLRPVDSVARADLALPRPLRDARPFEFVATPGVSAGPERTDPGAAERSTTDAAAASSIAVAAPSGTESDSGANQLPAHQPRPRVRLETQEPPSPAAAPEVRAIATTSARPVSATASDSAAPAPAIAATAAEERRPAPLAKLTPTSPLHEFWVQVGSFASRTRATALGQRLSDHGIVSRVTTRSTDTDVFFRVRVGPYGSRAEAEKFLAWVQQVEGLAGSYISEVRNAGG